MNPIETIRLTGVTPYLDALRLQEERHEQVARGEAPDTLILLEHAPTITLGRKAHREHLLRSPEQYRNLGIEVLEVNRGGDVTYHGPGQLVAYPILDLHRWKTSFRWYLRALEEVLIHQLSAYGLDAGRLDGYTGVWVSGAKVAAIGVAVRQWVTFHGIALNVAPDMAHFATIIPCGIADKPVTSLTQLMEVPPTMDRAAADFEEQFRRCFGQSPDADTPPAA